ncbi:GEVED domain-containing protein [Nocardioides insulae]|uniref:DUF7927 domain-containing protein n=1 Tax=Nocardioides insulae TaxID=394734 RepID=UPI0004090E1B|nr:GEVED domain-containing protein [Nocardioides insulae]
MVEAVRAWAGGRVGRRAGRSARHWRSRLLGVLGSLTLLTGLASVVVLPVVETPWTPAPPASAAPGSPGVMESPETFFFEDFENTTWPEPVGPTQIGTNPNAWDAGDHVQTLTAYPYGASPGDAGYQPGYTNDSGATYIADEIWAAGANCNGLVMAAHGSVSYANTSNDVPLPSTPAAADCRFAGTGSGPNRWFNSNRINANGMGQYMLGNISGAPYPYAGGLVPLPTSSVVNHVVTSFTNAVQPQTAGTMLELAEPIPVDAGRFYQFSVDIASQSCVNSGNGANPQFYLTQADGSESTAFTTPPDTCSGATASSFGQLGPGGGSTALGQQRTVRVGTWVGDTALRSTGDAIGLRVDNLDGSPAGNDTAFDNIMILDTTPKLDKEFTPAVAPVGSPAQLTFTVTNTHAPGDPDTPSGPKVDFAFTDTLSDPDLLLTGTSSTTCGDGEVTVDAATGTVELIGGDLVGPDPVTCTVTVGVTADVEGTFSNGPGDMELTGLNPPGEAEISFVEDSLECSASAYLFQNVPVDVFEVDLLTGAYDELHPDLYDQGINGVGYNLLDDYLYGAVTGSSPTRIVRVSASGTVTDLGTPPDWGEVANPQTTYNVGEFDDEGHLWLANGGSGSPLRWVEIDLDPDSATYLQVLASGSAGLPGVTTGIYDWGFDAATGTFLSLAPASSGGPRIVRFDPADGSLSVVGVPGALVGPNGAANPQASPWGAAYTTPDGYLYLANNQTGQIWRVDMAAPTSAEFFSYGPTSSNNDGTRCPTAPLPIDWGDAPDSYGTLLASGGPYHGVGDAEEPLLSIGESVTDEPDGQPAASAALDQDDAFATDPTVTIDAAETSLSIPIANSSGESAALVGWIDFDHSGTFEDDERAAVDAGMTSGDDVLTWTVPADAVPGDSYLRLRTVLGDADALPTDPTDIGPGVESGEVEDWPITLSELPLDHGDAPDSYGTLTTSGGASHAVVDYDEATNTAPLMLGDENTVDTEEDGVPTLGADGDDLAGVDDEGAVTEPVTAELGEEVVLDVLATNDSTSDATLVAWLDGDQSGTFDPGEASAAVTVPAGSGALTYPVTLPAASVPGDSYLRVRLFDGANGDPQPTGAWTGGEVEDYLVAVVEPELSVTKTSDAGGSVLPGDVLTYTVTVENTGTAEFTEADPASLADDLADVLDDATYNLDATVTPDQGSVAFDEPTLTLTWAGPLAVGETVTVTYTVTVDAPPAGDAVLENTVVAPDSSCGPDVDPADPACTVSTPVRSLEIEKTSDAVTEILPGQSIGYSFTVTNTGGYDYTAADPATAVDDLSAVLDDVAFSGEATVAPDQGTLGYAAPVLSWSGPLAAGESVTVTYTVTLDDPLTGDDILTNTVSGPAESNCGPGADPADPDCTVVLPAPGLDIVKTATPDTDPLLPGGAVDYTVVVTNTGERDYTAAAPAQVLDDLTGVLDDATYNDDAVSDPDLGAPEVTGAELEWFGPLAVGESVTITYSVTVDDPPGGDGVLTNAVTGPPESNCPEGTEEGCTTTTPVRTLAIAKTSDAAAEVLPDDTVTYTVQVSNPSTVAYTAADQAGFSDDLSAVLDDATFLEGSIVVDPSQGAASLSGTTLAWSGPLAAGETITVTYSVVVDDPPGGDGVLTNAVTGPPESNCPAGTEEGCTTTTPVRSVGIAKASDAVGEVLPGDTVTYSVEVTNTGGVDYVGPDSALTVTDDLSAVLDDATLDEASIVLAPDIGTAALAGQTLTWTGPLAVDDSVTITYTVDVDDPVAGDGVLTNAVTGPPESTCAEGTEEGCTTTTPVRSVGVVKTSDSPSGVIAGDQIAYTIEIANTGGFAFTAQDPATVADDLSAVLDDATLVEGSIVVDPDQGSANYDEPTLTWTGPLAVGDTVTISYTLTVADPVSGDGVLTNAVVGGGCPDPAVTDPDAPAYDPDCSTQVPVLEAGLEVTKTSDAGAEVVPGDTVTYTVTVDNTGEVAYPASAPATVSDDLSGVLDDASFVPGSIVLAPDIGTAARTGQRLTWSGPLAVGGTVTISYAVTVDDPPGGDAVLANAVVAPGSNCPAGAEDPACTTSTPVRALTIEKTVDGAAEVLPGGTVTYAVTVTNTGGVGYPADAPAVVSDDLAGVLDDASFDEGSIVVEPGQGSASYDEPTLTWTGPLTVGESVRISYSVTVEDPMTGDRVLTNVVTGPPESSCVEGTEAGCWVVVEPPPGASPRTLNITKSDDADGAVLPGDVVTYTVTVENPGSIAYTEESAAAVQDDLADVLDDATWNDDAAAVPAGGTVRFEEQTLSWSGPLGPGESVTLTYSLTVDAPVRGDGLLTNAVAGPAESNCFPSSDPAPARAVGGVARLAPECRSTVAVRQFEVSKQAQPHRVSPGGDVAYTLTVRNTGGVDYPADEPAVVRDDLSEALDDAAWNGDAAADTGEVSFAGPLLRWSGPLAAGETVTITYSLTVNRPSTGDADMVNAVVARSPGGLCLDGEDDNCVTTSTVAPTDSPDPGPDPGPGAQPPGPGPGAGGPGGWLPDTGAGRLGLALLLVVLLLGSGGYLIRRGRRAPGS